MDQPVKKTQFEMEEIATRCLEEAVQAGYIIVYNMDVKIAGKSLGEPFKKKVIINEAELVKHICKTIIGELLEFDLIRRIAPIYREEKRIEKDLDFIAGKHMAEASFASLRIHPSEPPEKL